MEVPFVNVKLPIGNRHEHNFLGAFEVLHKIRPEWNVKSIEFQVYTAGITNKIFSACVNGDDKVVFRVFGTNTEKFIDRDQEIEAMKKLANHNLAAPLYARFVNGIVCGYLRGSTLTLEEVKDPRMQKRICATMAAYHKMDATTTTNDIVALFPFRKIHEFISIIDFTTAEAQKADFVKDLPDQLRDIQSLVIPLNEDIAFCHNDLLVHNIVFDSLSDHVRFIDYEYADYNYTLFDLANHFCEYAGVENPDYSRCPTQEEIRSFVRLYLQERYKHVDECRVEELTQRCPLFQALAHLLWSAWSMVQSQNSTLDFNYVSYAKLRHEQYLKCLLQYKTSH